MLNIGFFGGVVGVVASVADVAVVVVAVVVVGVVAAEQHQTELMNLNRFDRIGSKS